MQVEASGKTSRSIDRLLPVSYGIGLLLLVGVLLPIGYLISGTSPGALLEAGRQTDVKSALLLSIGAAGIAMFVATLFGVPLAYALSRATFPGKTLILTAVDLPIVIPPPVVGIALLIFLGPRTPLRQFLEGGFHRYIIAPESWLGQALGGDQCFNAVLIVAAQLFVSWPFLVRSSLVDFQGVDERYERVARTLGSSSLGAFWRVTLPLAMRGIVAGMVLCWLRGMAEFGALAVLADNPKTAPILTMDKFNGPGRLTDAQPVAVLLVLASLSVFLMMWLLRAMPSGIAAVVRGRQGQADAAG